MIKKLLPLVLGLSLSISAFSADLTKLELANLTAKAVVGDVKAQSDLANYYMEKRDYDNKFYWTQKLANQGNINAQNNLGYMYRKGQGVAQDYEKAFSWYKKSATQGDVTAQYNLGLMYDMGEGISQDSEKAFDWFQKSANQGFAPAQYNLAMLYKEARGTHQNYKQTFKWV